MTPLDYYHNQCEKGLVTPDENQLTVMQSLQKLQVELIAEYKKRNRFWRLFRQKKVIRGIYLWGGVGIGKTFLMDCFYHTLPFRSKVRMHFHQFMQKTHEALTQHQGMSDPLEIIATEWSKEADVICFDEFFVSDITDAMLLGRLLKKLFQKGVCIVTTSNVKPDDLYKNGLQRSQFLPAIELIKQFTHVIHISSLVDYRLRHLKTAGVFYHPLNAAAEEKMEKTFEVLTKDSVIYTSPIILHGRELHPLKYSDTVIWFEFAAICSIPRSQSDYLLLARQYKTIFISNVPVIPADEKDTICLFISLVDVFYDARVKLVISAAESVTEIYSRGFKILEYTRTHSRLLEMQSTDYFLF